MTVTPVAQLYACRLPWRNGALSRVIACNLKYILFTIPPHLPQECNCSWLPVKSVTPRQQKLSKPSGASRAKHKLKK